jgi:hypothetical protein
MRIYFKEDTHQYFNESGEEYKSVSHIAKLLDKKDAKFWENVKKKKAKKLGISVDELTKEWDRKKKLGTEAGTILHLDRELELISSEFNYLDVIHKKAICPIEGDYKFSLPIEGLQNNTVYPELMIYDHEAKICGQSDKVIVTNNTIHIEDYKTDKSIDRRAYSSEFVEPEKLKAPVAHLDNCNFNVYSLKMSIYMYMLWKKNKHLRVGKLILEHLEINRDKEGVPILENGKPVLLNTTRIEVPYLRKEVRDIFEYYKLNKL